MISRTASLLWGQSSWLWKIPTYVRVINQRGQIHVALLISKNRLAPVKAVTIPRLELLAAVVASKLDCVVNRELDVELPRSTFSTDSMITLAYIQSESRRFKTFVANRVSLIRENSIPDQWCHIVGNDNPADILSRGCNASVLPTVWFEGPRFLSEYKSSWSIQPSAMPGLIADDNCEMKRHKSYVENTPCVFNGNVKTTVVEARQHPLDVLILFELLSAQESCKLVDQIQVASQRWQSKCW